MAKTSNGSASIFAGMKKVNEENVKKEKIKPAVVMDEKPKTENPTGEEPASKTPESVSVNENPKTVEKTEPAVTEPGPVSSDHADMAEAARVIHGTPADVKATSITIQQSSANFLAYKTKMIGENRDTCLAMIISKDLESGENAVPDFFAPVEKKQRIDCVNKSVRLPADILDKAKRKAAVEMKTLSGYIDDLLQNEIKKM